MHLSKLILGIGLSLPSYGSPIVLKTAFQDSFPKYYQTGQDPGEFAGICYEILREVEKIEPKVKFSFPGYFVPFKRIQKNLAKSSAAALDVFFGMAKNDKRQKKYQFIEKSLYKVQHKVAVRFDDNISIKSFAGIKRLGQEGKILTNYGTATTRYLQKQEGLIIDADGKDISKNIAKLISGKGRFVYFHDIGLIGTIKRDFPGNQVRVLSHSFRSYSHYVAFNKNVPSSTIALVKDALELLDQQGVLQQITERYTKISE